MRFLFGYCIDLVSDFPLGYKYFFNANFQLSMVVVVLKEVGGSEICSQPGLHETGKEGGREEEFLLYIPCKSVFSSFQNISW